MSDEWSQATFPNASMVEGTSPNELSFPCDQCEETFQSSKKLMVHVRKADNHKPICKACDKSFDNFDNMRIHKRKYHYEPSEFVQFVCDSCGKSCKTKDLLRDHWNFVHKVEPGLNCNLCGRSCQNMLKLKRHMKMCLSRDPQMVAEVRTQLAEKVNQVYSPQEPEDSVAKLELEKDKNSTSQYKANESTYNLYEAAKPEDDKHLEDIKQEILSDGICSVQVTVQSSSTSDTNEMLKPTNHSLSYPYGNIIENDGLTKSAEHGLIKVEVEPDIDEQMKPAKKKYVRIRNQKGTYVEPKVCPICAKFVKYLNGHIKDVHTESNEKHICNDCGKVFSKLKKLRGHVDAVHKDQPTMCDICSQVFKNVHALRGHKRKMHEKDSEVSCPSCSKVFANKIKLYDHERAVHTLQDSICPACGKTYKNKNLLQKHVKVYHKDMYENQTKYFETFN